MEVNLIDQENGEKRTDKVLTELAPLKVSFYELLIRQLQDDGFSGEAHSISQQLHIAPNNRVEKDTLVEAYGKSLRYGHGDEPMGNNHWIPFECTPVPPVSAEEHVLDFDSIARSVLPGADPDGDAPMNGSTKESATAPKQNPKANLLYSAQHRLSCQAVAYSQDGRFCATGSADGTCKVLDCQEMRITGTASEGPLGKMRVTEEHLLKPIVRTYQDHTKGVNCVTFHPLQPTTLFTGSEDRSVKMFDLNRPAGHKKASAVLQDVHPVRCICVHPCGDFILVGTSHNVIRLHDLHTMQCFTAFHQDHHHSSAVNDVRSTSDGRMFASVSADGSIKLWDGVSLRVVNTLPQAHGALAVTSVRWSRNLNYVLSAGNDGRSRIWDIRRGSEVLCMGLGPRSCDYATSVFAASERYVVSAMVGTGSNNLQSDVSIFDSKTGSPVCSKLGHHQQPVHALDASPSDRSFMTGCDDNKARYFSIEL
mmetsp:Transcript_73942/g.175977  ORF Transcript_73942/g.175977 Transcript_73942/m.175977 type:complete len:479 (-) Transcript_73942:48-1484(-)